MLPLTLSDRQKSIMATALTTISLVVLASIAVWVFSLFISFFAYFSGVFLPLAVAGILATLMKPYYNWLFSKLKNKAITLVFVIVSLVLPVALFSMYFGSLLVSQLTDFISALPIWIEKAQLYVEDKLPVIRNVIEKYDLKDRVSDFTQGRTGLIAGSAAFVGKGVVSTGAAVFNTVTGLLGWLVLPVYFIFMIQAPVFTGKNLESNLPFLTTDTRKDVVYLITEFASIIVAFFRGQLIVALCQGMLFALGFTVVGLENGIVLGLLLGFLNIIPYLGNIIGLIVVLPLAWFHPEGGMNLLLGVMLVFVLVQIIEGYFLTPRIMGQSTGLHPMAIIFAILFWGTALNGLLGMVLAIPLTAFLVVFWRLMKTKYIKEWI